MTATLRTMLKQFHQRINGPAIKYDMKLYFRMLDEIKKYELNLKKKTDKQLNQISQKLITQAQKDTSLDDLLIEAFALVHEAAFRVLNLSPFDVQILGAIALHNSSDYLGKCPQVKAKQWLRFFLPYLNAINGQWCAYPDL